MGIVYRAVDDATGRRVALKRFGGSTSSRHLLAMFEREYDVLKRLQHPRIIQVFEYGRDVDGPYYTMELLDGKDLRNLAPLESRRACALLVDVASSLALLHARRLLHRDLSPRNVRCTSDGRCKLLDFGTMTAFGTSTDVAGTAPFVPPEALQRGALDQRADLYSLGALSYYLLTGRHAYPAQKIEDLRRVWRTPPPAPSSLASGVPEELDALVMGLLSLDALARPRSAAEVIDRLNAIGGLAPEEDAALMESYLASTHLVGREEERAALSGTIASAVAGQGGSVLIEGEQGLGKTRLLEEASVLGQVRGATMLRVACDGDRRGYGVALRLAQALLVALPEPSHRAAASELGILGHFVQELRDASLEPGSLPEQAIERRARLQASLVDWFVRVSREYPLLIAVDDLHLADEPSAAFVTGLARAAGAAALLLVVTARPGPSEVGTALSVLRATGRLLVLARFDAAQSERLVVSLFGDAPRAERLGKWLYEQASGNPLVCFELLDELAHQGQIRYAEAMWTLPTEPDLPARPAGVQAQLNQRLGRLSPRAKQLAEVLSLYDGAPTEELCIALADGEHAFSVLDELVSSDVLVASEKGFRFSRQDFRGLLRQAIAEEDVPRLHLRLGRELAARAGTSPELLLEAGRHLVDGGDAHRGAELLERGSEAPFTDGMGTGLSALEAALAVYEREGRAFSDRLRIRSKLVAAAFPVDRHLAIRYGEATLEDLVQGTGVRIASDLGAVLGKSAGLYTALALTTLRRLTIPRAVRPPSVQKIFPDFLAVLGSLLGVACSCLDIDTAERLVALVSPLRGFGEKHIGTAFYEHTLRFLNAVRGREAEAHAGSVRFLEQLDESKGVLAMSEEMRTRWKAGSWIIRGLMEIYRDGPGALECADRLESFGFQFHRAWAHQIRMLYHALRGEARLAEPHRAAVEAHLLQNGSIWQLEIGPEVNLCVAYALTEDLVGAKQALEQLERLRKEIPSLGIYARLVRVLHLYLVGAHETALASGEEVLREVTPRRLIGWPFLYTVTARILNALGRHEEARERCLAGLAHVQPEDREFVGMYLPLERELALSEAGANDPHGACRRLDALIEERASPGGPLTLGSLHEARASIALEMGDLEAFERHLDATERWFRPTENPALIARVERLRSAGRDATPGAAAPDVTERGSMSAATQVDGSQSVTMRESRAVLDATVVDAEGTEVPDPAVPLRRY